MIIFIVHKNGQSSGEHEFLATVALCSFISFTTRKTNILTHSKFSSIYSSFLIPLFIQFLQ